MTGALVERTLVGLLVALWLASVVLHVDLALRDRLAWAPIYVTATEGPGGVPRVDGFWSESVERPDRPRRGDRVLRVGEQEAAGRSRLGFLAAVYAEAADDSTVPLVVARDGVRVDTRLELIPYNAPWIFAPLVLGLGICASLVYARRRDVPAARAAAMGMLAYSLHWAAFLSGGGWRTITGFAVHVVALSFAAPLCLRAVQLVTKRGDGSSTARWPWLFLALGPLHASWQIGAPIPPANALSLLLAGYLAFVLCLFVTLGLGYRDGDAVVRRQLRWVVLGFYLALAPLGVTAALGAWEPAWRPLYEWSLLALVMIPIGTTVALTRFELFDVDRLVSATAAYSIVVIGLIGLSLVALPSVAVATEKLTDLRPEVVQAGLSLLLAVGLVFGGNAVRPRLERLFFRERAALDRGIRALRDDVRRFDDPAPLLERVGEELVELLRLQDCTVYVLAERTFVPLFVQGAGVPAAFDGMGRLAPLLESTGAPVDAAQWRQWAELGLLADLERAQLEGLDAHLLLGIPGEKGLLGFACLGEKGSGDVYTPVDRALLEGLLDRVAAQLERFDAKEIQEAQRERSARLARYVPAAVRDELRRSVAETAPGEREVSVLFVDIRGYTTLSEPRTPDEIFRIVNAYTTAVSREVQEHRGWVVEFQGDGLMAVFGAPRAQHGKERHATEAARAIVDRIEAGIDEIADVPLRVGVGVATGSAYVGNVRSVDREIWCVIGNTTNLAARLQAMTRDVEGSIVIDDLTRERAGDAAADFTTLDGVRVKGRSAALTVHYR